MSRALPSPRPILSLGCLALALAGCDGGNATDDAGTSIDTGVGVDAPAELRDTGPSVADSSEPDAPRSDAGPLPAFDVPRDRTWHYVELEGTECGNGTPLGIGLNLDPTSDRVLLFLQGGGACWDVASCVLLQTASHLTDTLDEATVLGEARRAGGFTLDREDAENPYRDQSFVYVPYCTGDVHAGNHVATYSTPRTTGVVHHRGAHNTEIILSRLAATFPDLDRLTMEGESAGGYGVAVNAFRGRLAFPSARVDVLDDSGILVDADPEQWAQMMETWRPPLPADCPECLDRLTNLIAYYGRTMGGDERFAMLASREDDTIRTYFSYTATQLATAVDASVVLMEAQPNMHVFVNDGSQHVLVPRAITTSDGTTVRAWVTAFANDDPTWGTVGP